MHILVAVGHSLKIATPLVGAFGIGAFASVLMSNYSAKKREQATRRHERKASLYSELTRKMDNFLLPGERNKAEFVEMCYQALIYAPDEVIKALEEYILSMSVLNDPEEYLNDPVGLARREALLCMRRDALKDVGLKTKLENKDMYYFEITDPRDQDMELSQQ